MWLINTRTLKLESFLESAVPPYAILSHTWAEEEVTFSDMRSKWNAKGAKHKKGFAKIRQTCVQACRDFFAYAWIDTCCIDKSSSAELQEAINSMYRWYEQAKVCYVYLPDFSSAKVAFPSHLHEETHMLRGCKWFTRGWTLQELIAPREVRFYGANWTCIGTKATLAGALAYVTGVDFGVLTHSRELSSLSIATRMSWAADRHTSRVEDRAYSLLGIFNVSMPMLYGEGTRAFVRLQEELMKYTSDHSIFAWNSADSASTSLLADSPANFSGLSEIVSWGRPGSFEMTNRGLRATFSIILDRNSAWRDDGAHLAILNCRLGDDLRGCLALRLRQYPGGEDFYVHTAAAAIGARVDRLAFVPADAISDAGVRVVQITRTHEHTGLHGPKFWLKCSNTNSHSRPPHILTVRPDSFWNAETAVGRDSAVLHPSDGPRVFGTAQVQLPSLRHLVFRFGYEESPKFEEWGSPFSKRFILGLSVLFVGKLPSDWQPPRFISGSGLSGFRCGHDASCQVVSPNGCANTPTRAEIGKRPDAEVVKLEIKETQIMGEQVFVIEIAISHMYELEAAGLERDCELEISATRRFPDSPSLRSNSSEESLIPVQGSPKPLQWLRPNPPVVMEEPWGPRIILRNDSGRIWRHRDGMLEEVVERPFLHQRTLLDILDSKDQNATSTADTESALQMVNTDNVSAA